MHAQKQHLNKSRNTERFFKIKEERTRGDSPPPIRAISCDTATRAGERPALVARVGTSLASRQRLRNSQVSILVSQLTHVTWATGSTWCPISVTSHTVKEHEDSRMTSAVYAARRELYRLRRGSPHSLLLPATTPRQRLLERKQGRRGGEQRAIRRQSRPESRSSMCKSKALPTAPQPLPFTVHITAIPHSNIWNPT